jgi:hypothetical protein
MQCVIEIGSLTEKRGYRVIDNLDVIGKTSGTAYQGYRPRGETVVLSRPGADGPGRGTKSGFGVDRPGGVDLVLGRISVHNEKRICTRKMENVWEERIQVVEKGKEQRVKARRIT